MQEPADQPRPTDPPGIRPGIRRARMVSAAAGLVLVSAMVMPAVSGCKQPIIPVLDFIDVATDRPLSLETLFWALVLTPYLFGGLLLGFCLRTLNCPAVEEELAAGRTMARFAALTVTTTLVWLLTGIIADLVGGARITSGPLVWAVVCTMCAVYLLRCLGAGPAGRVCARWGAALCCVIWFTSWLGTHAYYGLYISLGAALLAAGATFHEARLRSGAGRWRTLWQLLSRTLRLRDLEDRVCMGCGYLLVGRASDRCPECGRTLPAAAPATETAVYSGPTHLEEGMT